MQSRTEKKKVITLTFVRWSVGLLLGLHVGLVVGSCVICRAKNVHSRTSDGMVTIQHRVLIAKNKFNQTHVRGLVGRLTRQVLCWTGHGICSEE